MFGLYDDELCVLGGSIVVISLMVWAIVHFSNKEQKEWEKFAIEHNCKAVEYMKGGVGTTVGNTYVNGQVGVSVGTIVEPDKTCYACDDGKKYWR
jgi:hypothetical protein